MNILPIVEKHNINSGLQHAFTLSIVLANSEIAEWYNESYILPIMFEFYEDIQASSCEYLDAYAYSDISAYKDIFSQHGYSDRFINSEDVIDLIKYFIDSQKYVVVFVDEYYLKKCNLGGKVHFLHEEMIYGYDDDSLVLYSLGINKEGQYGTIEHGYNEFYNAYIMGLNCSNHANILWAKENRVITLEILKRSTIFKACSEHILSSIRRYIHPAFSSVEKYKLFSPTIKKMYLGIECYKLIDHMSRSSKDVFMLSNLMLEHNKIMLDHFLSLNLERALLDEFVDNILSLSRKMRMLSLKRKYLTDFCSIEIIDDKLNQMTSELYYSEINFYNKII